MQTDRMAAGKVLIADIKATVGKARARFEPCMTEIYLHIDARMADYIHTYRYRAAFEHDVRGMN